MWCAPVNAKFMPREIVEIKQAFVCAEKCGHFGFANITDR
jgi:hypothetical protein